MRNLLLILMAVIAFTACDKKDVPDVSKGKLDPNAMILIKPDKGVKTRATIDGLTAFEVVEQALNIKWNTHYSDNEYSEEVWTIGRGFDVKQKDFTIPALKMWGIDIINQDGEYVKDFTHAFNVVFTDNNNDTIAYIPDEVINAVRPLIETAYLEEDYTEVYRLFDEAFTFVPY